MLPLIWLVLCLVVVSFIALLLALWRRDIYKRLSGSRLVACPENQQAAVVSFDRRHAAATEMDGRPEMRLCDCSRWPEHSQCDQACLSQAVQTEPYKQGEVKPGTKPIHHLPIILAAFAAWVLGAIWHSRFMFRAQWMKAVGLTHEQVKQIVWWVSPHLLTAAICLLFAYGVACLLAVCHRKGVLQGVLMSVLLCAALIAATWHSMSGLPHDLFAIEAGYAILAAVTVGAIEGGLFDKLVLRSQ